MLVKPGRLKREVDRLKSLRGILFYMLGCFASCVWAGEGEATNGIPVCISFDVPKPQLRLVVGEKASALAAAEVVEPQTKETSVEEWLFSVEKPVMLSEISIQAYEAMNGGRVLTYVEAPAELGGAAGWVTENVWDPVFAPEVVKIGKVKFTGGVVAAIRRKNPFCLLNPLVFGMGW